jgi:hypothetical protein
LGRGGRGPPPPRYASGTVEEFEDSLASRRRTGWPREILLYFIRDDRPEPPLLQFKRSLTDRSYLYQEVEEAEFVDRVEQALFDIATHWNRPWVWLKRTGRGVVRPAIVAAALLALAYGAYAAVTVARVTERIDAHDLGAACERLRGEARFMPFDLAGLGRRIDADAAATIGASIPPERKIAVFATWRHCPTPRLAFRARQTDLAGETKAAVTAAVTSPLPADRDVALLQTAEAAGLFDIDPDAAAELRRLSAARRLLDVHLAPAADPFGRFETHLGAEEQRAVRDFAAMVHRIGAAAWPPAARRALAAAGGDTAVISDALMMNSMPLPPEARDFVAAAVTRMSDGALHQLLTRMLPSTRGMLTDPLLVDLVLSTLAKPARSERATLLGAMIAGVLRKLEESGDLTLPSELRDTVEQLISEGAASDGALGRFVDRASYPKWVRGLVFAVTQRHAAATRAADAGEQLPPCAAIDRAGEILRTKGTGDLTDTIVDIAMIGILAARRPDCASPNDAPFSELLSAHARGSVSFGFAERAALITAYRRDASKRRMLAEITARSLKEAASMTGAFSPNPATVENAWLAGWSWRGAPPEERDLLASIIRRRARNPAPDDAALAAALDTVPEKELLAMLAFPSPPIVDPPWSDNWTFRDVALSALSHAPRPPNAHAPPHRPEIGWAVLGSLPFGDDDAAHRRRSNYSDIAYRLLDASAHAALIEAGRRGDSTAFTHLAAMGAFRVPAARTLLDALTPEAITAILAGVCRDEEACDRDAATELLGGLMDRQTPILLASSGPLLEFLHAARRARFGRLARIVDWLSQNGWHPASMDQLTALAVYFEPEPALLLALWSGADQRAHVLKLVAESDQTSWLFLTQSLMSLARVPLPPTLRGLAEARALAFILPRIEAGPEHGLPVDGSLVANPFLLSYGSSDVALDERVATLQRMAGQAGNRADSNGPGVVEGPLLRAFAVWLLARLARDPGSSCLPGLDDPLAGLRDGHPAIRSAHASLVIALTRCTGAPGL